MWFSLARLFLGLGGSLSYWQVVTNMGSPSMSKKTILSTFPLSTVLTFVPLPFHVWQHPIFRSQLWSFSRPLFSWLHWIFYWFQRRWSFWGYTIRGFNSTQLWSHLVRIDGCIGSLRLSLASTTCSVESSRVQSSEHFSQPAPSFPTVKVSISQNNFASVIVGNSHNWEVPLGIIYGGKIVETGREPKNDPKMQGQNYPTPYLLFVTTIATAGCVKNFSQV